MKNNRGIPYLIFMLVLVIGLIVLMVASMNTNAAEIAAEPEIVGRLVIPAKRLPERETEREVKTLTREEKFALKMARWLELKEAQKEQPEPVMEYLGRYKITGYDICAQCCGKSDGITASGTQATVGRTCAAGRDLPFGTVLYIDGIGYRTVEDRGGGVNGNHIDVLCEDHSHCYAITGWYDVYVVEAVE